LTGYLDPGVFPDGYVKPSDFISPPTPTWTRFTPIGTGPRGAGEGSQSAAYDAANDRLIVFGGFDVFSPCCVLSNDTWVLKNATGSGGTPTWQQLSPAAPQGLPAARTAHSAVYDPTTNRTLIFGGGQPNGFAFSPLFNDVWVLTNGNGLGGTPEWVPVTPSGGPPAPREGHGAYYRQATNEMIVFGGANNGIMSVPGDLWVLENANGLPTPTAAQWVPLPQTGAAPGRIEHFASAYDPISNRLTIALGCCFYTNATRVLDLNASGGIPQWTNLSPTGTLPPIGDAQNYGYDAATNRLFVQTSGPGGWSSATWLLTNVNVLGNTGMWVNTIPKGAPGTPPEASVAVIGSAYNAATKKFVVALNRIDPSGNLVSEVWVLASPDQIPTTP